MNEAGTRCCNQSRRPTIIEAQRPLSGDFFGDDGSRRPKPLCSAVMCDSLGTSGRAPPSTEGPERVSGPRVLRPRRVATALRSKNGHRGDSVSFHRGWKVDGSICFFFGVPLDLGGHPPLVWFSHDEAICIDAYPFLFTEVAVLRARWQRAQKIETQNLTYRRR